MSEVPGNTPTASISDEAARAAASVLRDLFAGPCLNPPPLGATMELRDCGECEACTVTWLAEARAILAAAAPLLVSAEAERASEPKLCGVLGYYGAKNEPLACGWTWHSGDRHSWSSLAALRAAGGQEKWRDEPKCRRCGGTGGVPFEGDMVECHNCEGTGVAPHPAAPVGGQHVSAGSAVEAEPSDARDEALRELIRELESLRLNVKANTSGRAERGGYLTALLHVGSWVAVYRRRSAAAVSGEQTQ